MDIAYTYREISVAAKELDESVERLTLVLWRFMEEIEKAQGGS